MSDEYKNEKDRRREPRFIQRIKVKFRCGDERWRTGETGDISYRGMFITSKRSPESETVEIKLSHRRQKLILKGNVLRPNHEVGFAVELTEQPETWLELCRSLRQNLPRQRRTTELQAQKSDDDE